MKKTFYTHLTVAVLLTATLMSARAQEEAGNDKGGYTFTMKVDLPATPVKNQYRSGTCWSFSALSFLESELLRMEKGEYDLSEMFVVRNAYEEKADRYVRVWFGPECH